MLLYEETRQDLWEVRREHKTLVDFTKNSNLVLQINFNAHILMRVYQCCMVLAEAFHFQSRRYVSSQAWFLYATVSDEGTQTSHRPPPEIPTRANWWQILICKRVQLCHRGILNSQSKTFLSPFPYSSLVLFWIFYLLRVVSRVAFIFPPFPFLFHWFILQSL